MCSRLTLITLPLLISMTTTSTAHTETFPPSATNQCTWDEELRALAHTVDGMTAKPQSTTQAAKRQLVGIFDGGWLIAMALGDHGRASCFAQLSDSLGLSPSLPMTGDDTELERAKVPPGLARQIHQTAMRIIRRL